ncbi:hypothetical protein N7448_003073 [Penicillium atrosanguineum]|uniref:Uncharacterized protein n=1 Tax=Penicillium atrosanguineum TaxID=1132637 RepID=A0A9W9U3F3_9EURO|nr:hypothetical protein N7526_008877 [Penicillium atrosanguineum]KAJ5139665.1 hypothetical protein N7448_003073 [Penicillium atrosanguineum]KAJ5315107.1 hypothetical protein N7476_005414 [Penicillium atrosanguineum]
MLPDLPSEIILHIAIHLPTVNSLTHLAQTCRRLYKIVTAEEAAFFRAFIQRQFPSTKTPLFWKDAACALTSRSRALDRLGIIGRFVLPPENVTRVGYHQETRDDNPTLGYRPPIDSYETWNGDSWADKKEVLAWGAGHQLLMRIKQSGSQPHENWIVFNDRHHVSSYDDICGLHLMGPESGGKKADIEHLILGRIRGDIVRLALSASDTAFETKQRFATKGMTLDRTDLSDGSEPIISGHFDNGSIALYHTVDNTEEVEPFTWIEPNSLSRSRYSKLLSSTRIAVATGRSEDTLSISTISPDGISRVRQIGVESLDIEDQIGHPAHSTVSAIAPLNSHRLAGNPGDVFLAAWGDRTIRLHDLRTPHSYETTYIDTTDPNLTYSVHPFGHDRFLAGSGGDALVKIFDLRMDKTYDYLDAQVSHTPSLTSHQKEKRAKRPRKNFSLFLSSPPPPLFRQQNGRNRRRGPYRGPVYTMSTPSPSSQTVYTGIVDGVVRLDFASMDDLAGPTKEWYERVLDLNLPHKPGMYSATTPDNSAVLRLAGFERPDPDDLTTTSKLRTQTEEWCLNPESQSNKVEEDAGWDWRWQPLSEPGAWRRRDG